MISYNFSEWNLEFHILWLGSTAHAPIKPIANALASDLPCAQDNSLAHLP